MIRAGFGYFAASWPSRQTITETSLGHVTFTADDRAQPDPLERLLRQIREGKVQDPDLHHSVLAWRSLLTGYGIAAFAALGLSAVSGVLAGWLTFWLGGAALGLGLSYLKSIYGAA